MLPTALLCAVLCYAGAAALAATPFARPVGPPVRSVVGALGAGVVLHLLALAVATREAGHLALAGLGPALSFAGLALAAILLAVEALARDISLTLVAAPLAAVVTAAAAVLASRELDVQLMPAGVRGAWLAAHIALSFIGIAAFGTAAAAGMMYLIERRELKSRRFGAVFRAFPPLETLDRVNHLGALAAAVALTVGVVLAAVYSITYRSIDVPQMVWGIGAWFAASALALGRVGWQWPARRAAVVATVGFALVLVSYVAARAMVARSGQFL